MGFFDGFMVWWLWGLLSRCWWCQFKVWREVIGQEGGVYGVVDFMFGCY